MNTLHITTFASLPVCHWFACVPEEVLLAKVAVLSFCVVSAGNTNSPRLGLLVKFHVEATFCRMSIAVACFKGN